MFRYPRAGHPWPGAVLCIPVLISEDLPGYPGRPVRHQPVPGSDRRKYRHRRPLWRTAGFEPDRPAHRKERALCRRYAGISPRPGSPVAAGRPRRQHQCVLLHARNNEAEWHLVSGKKSIKLHVSGPVAARDFDAVSAFTYRGHGVGLLPSTYCDAQIARGELVRLLPGWSSPEIFVHAVYPTRRFLPAKLQVFLEHLKAWKSPLSKQYPLR